MIGKSALVEAFLRTVRASVEGAPIGFGQCVEQHGQEEPSMAVLDHYPQWHDEAIGSHLRTDGAE